MSCLRCYASKHVRGKICRNYTNKVALTSFLCLLNFPFRKLLNIDELFCDVNSLAKKANYKDLSRKARAQVPWICEKLNEHSANCARVLGEPHCPHMLILYSDWRWLFALQGASRHDTAVHHLGNSRKLQNLSLFLILVN